MKISAEARPSTLTSHSQTPGLRTEIASFPLGPTLYETYCRPELGQLLRTLALDTEYGEARGDELITKEGKVILDFLGGYGSTILGHNPSEIREHVETLLKRNLPVHAQASARVEAGLLAEQLNRLLTERLGLGERGKFISLFLATGTEAVEAAIKHSLMSWQSRRAQIDLQLSKLENTLLQTASSAPLDRTSRAALSGISLLREKLKLSRPVLLAFEGSYHGKTAGSLAVTANATYGQMYPGKAFEVEFISRTASAEDIESILQKHRIEFGEESASFSCVAAGFVEWIQGEGGIHPISTSTAQALSRALSIDSIPLVADEIQTGLFRTGTLLATEGLGVSPDYILLGKSLGGGYAKISSVSIRESAYVPEFGRLHTSTFADDDFSCSVARRTLSILENNPSLQTRANAFEMQVRDGIKKIQDQYPGIIKEVRGKGWMLGIEFDLDLNGEAPHLLNAINQTGFTLYSFASWLLNRKNIRVAATLNKACTLRLEPSSQISRESTQALLESLEELCLHLFTGNLVELLEPILRPDRKSAESPASLRISPRRTKAIQKPKEMRKATFLSHLIDSRHVAALDPAFLSLSSSRRQEFLAEIAPLAGSIPYHEQVITSDTGESVLLQLRGITCLSRYFEDSIRNKDGEACRKVLEAAEFAARENSDVIGLGQFTSIVTDNGVALRELPTLNQAGAPALTTGNSLTVGLAYRAILRVLEERGRSLENSRVAIIGAAGNICSVYARLMAEKAAHLTLVHREPLELSKKFQYAYHQILNDSGVNAERLAHKISTTHLIDEVSTCDVVICGTNSTRQFIESRHLKKDAIVLDIGVPSNIHPDVLRDRKDVECFQGGHAALPGTQKLLSPLVPTENGEIFACMAETLAMALAGRTASLSIGALTRESVMEALAMADQVGIRLGKLKKMSVI